MRYTRYLSESFCDLLLPSGPLHFLVADFGKWLPEDRNALDLQLREGDTLMYYHGTTKFLTVTYARPGASIQCSAEAAYAKVPGYDQVMRRWPVAEVGQLSQALPGYFREAVATAGQGYYRNRSEGYWQNRLALAFGLGWCPGKDWLIFDREVIWGYAHEEERAAAQGPVRQKYLEVRSRLQQEDPGKWGTPDTKGFGNEVDFLALGPDGELFCIELKDGSNTSGIYWGRLQAAVYGDLFRQALDQITEGIHQLVRQKVELGLLPQAAVARLPQEGFRGVFPVLAVAMPNPRSAAWTMSAEVLARCPEANVPLFDIRNFEDPAPVIRVL